MIRFTQRSKASASPIRQIFAKIPQVKAALAGRGISLIDLSIGQPHIEPNPEVIRRIEKDPLTHAPSQLGYTGTTGEAETLEAIVRLYRPNQ